MSSAITINPLAAVQEFLRATAAKEWVAMRNVVADDAVWNLPGTSAISGERRGGDAIVARAKQLAEYGVNVKIERFLYGLTDVVLLLHNTGQRGDLALNEHLCNVCRVSGGKIISIETYVSDMDMLNAFFV
jgi:ketosteroid isomerase-like protein